MNNIGFRGLLFALFTLSGFSGLIYESIWTHYLKLFLGHAAYAQTLVLGIFMGGMALGAWICGTRSARWKNLLLLYALVEGAIGVAALIFHPLFDGYVQFAYLTLLPALADPTSVTLLKWSSAALLILPQSILLGMTFPLMSGALIRRFPGTPGATVAMLYFTNSIGAAIGVLVSGFVLIEAVGLPGTIQIAGAINITLALVVWGLARGAAGVEIYPSPPVQAGSRLSPLQQGARGKNQNELPSQWVALFLGIALLTGAASFIYEIAWIRMLSLVLSSSTHAFELMLSAFVLGLALGGLWIKRRIDTIADPVRFLAIVQVVMGALALATLPLYNVSFDAMRWVISAAPQTEAGYFWFNVASHAIAMVVMLPATFCAGMTLPLITFVLMKRGYGERSLGNVYASNTVGAIVGVFFATHMGMPLLGLKNLLVFGAAIDIALGVVLVWRFIAPLPQRFAQITSGIGFGALALAVVAVDLNPYKMASGVYRSGALFDPDNTEIVYHKDGKTASIDVLKYAHNDAVTIGTNGKPDASINMAANGDPSPDELTMILAGVLPLAMRPNTTTAAVIGFGSGLTTHTLASIPAITTVDTIEIEAAMIDGAQHFLPRVEQAYRGANSHLYIDDAKTFFSSRNKKYDLIVSEPSNPWVSGVSNLFTDEFYRLSKRHLIEGGILVQWIQMYEIDVDLIASVVKALSSHYANYVVYASNDIDLLLIASDAPQSLDPSPQIFGDPDFADVLAQQGIHSMHDLQLHRIGDRRVLQPLFDSYPIAKNSDYYPVLDTHAARTRFLNRGASEFAKLMVTPGIPLTRMLAPTPRTGPTVYTPSPYFAASVAAYDATLIRDFLLTGQTNPQYDEITEYLKGLAQNLRRSLITCEKTLNAGDWVTGTVTIAKVTLPFLSPSEFHQIWDMALSAPCYANTSAPQRAWINLMLALANRDAAGMVRLSVELLDSTRAMDPAAARFLLQSAMLGALIDQRNNDARSLWRTYSPLAYPDRKIDILSRLYMAAAGIAAE